jgi:hypothetical protein
MRTLLDIDFESVTVDRPRGDHADMPCRPPLPAGSLSQLTVDLGIPFDSLSSANARLTFLNISKCIGTYPRVIRTHTRHAQIAGRAELECTNAFDSAASARDALVLQRFSACQAPLPADHPAELPDTS